MITGRPCARLCPESKFRFLVLGELVIGKEHLEELEFGGASARAGRWLIAPGGTRGACGLGTDAHLPNVFCRLYRSADLRLAMGKPCAHRLVEVQPEKEGVVSTFHRT